MSTSQGSFSAPAPAPSRKEPRRRWWVWLFIFLGGLCILSTPVLFCTTTLRLLSGGGVVSAGPVRVQREYVRGPRFGPEVAVVMLEGPIVSTRGATTQRVIAAQEVVDLTRWLDQSSQVRAIVLAINSPGGGVAASETIYHALEQVEKPVVAYFGDVAASGGYYIAMAADEIVANRATLTGSIGVIAVFPHAEKLMDKVGIQVVVVKSGPHKDMGSLFREMTPEERAHIQSIVNGMYDRFVEVVAQGRKMPADEVRQLADGRIYSGEQALELGLVDALGFEDDAVQRAAALAGLTQPPRVVRYYPGLSPWSLLFGGQAAWASWQPWTMHLQPGLYYMWLP